MRPPGSLILALLAVAALIGVHPSPASAASGEVLYGADGAQGNLSNLYVLNPATGAIVTTVGPIGFAVTGLDVHPTTGVLYGTTSRTDASSPGHLITINKATGAGTVVGDLAPTIETAADITFGADGILYGWFEPGSDDLVTINLATGAATIVGNAGISTAGAGLAGNGNPLRLAGDGDLGCLYSIDITTGDDTCPVTLTGGLGGSWEIGALDFNAAGTLFGVRLNTNVSPRPADLLTIDTTTGAITVIGATVQRLDAIAFDPPQPVVATKTADAPTSAPGGTNGYTITISNPNAAEATVTSITDTLPAGFSYVAGSTTGATTTNPSIAGSLLTWAGPFTAPAGGSVTISFDVTVSAAAGTYTNQAGGTADANAVTGTGPTAPIVVTAAPTASPTASPAASLLPNTSAGGVAADPVLLVGSVVLLLLALPALLGRIATARARR